MNKTIKEIYEEGRQAFLDGKEPVTTYKGKKRVAFFDGYDDAQVEHRRIQHKQFVAKRQPEGGDS